MNKKKLGKTDNNKKDDTKNAGRTYPRPSWVPKTVLGEEELCPDCFKVVGGTESLQSRMHTRQG